MKTCLDVSIVIPTCNRPDDLLDVLNCILLQTILPKEVVIVDDSNNSKTEQLIEDCSDSFLSKQIVLSYVRNTKGKSLTVARNVGAQIAVSDIILFTDDDVLFHNDYVDEILKVYENYPNAVGVQGYIAVGSNGSLSNALHKLFCLSYQAPDVWKILPSGEEVFPFPLTKPINCPRLSGANQSYRKSVFNYYSFDETLKGYAFGEDKDFSFRLNKKFQDGLFVTPHARLVHKESTKSRLPKKSSVFMKTVYDLYFYYNNMPQSISNKLAFAWSKIGALVALSIGVLLKKNAISEKLQIICLLRSYFFALKHHEEIKLGNMKFFDEVLSN